MQKLETLGHNPADRIAAMSLAQEYGTKLFTGVFYRNPSPGPTFGVAARQRQDAMKASARTRESILDGFRPKG